MSHKSRYRIGYAFEREIREKFRKAGFTVFRCCGSRPIDLIIVKDGKVVLVEVKRGASRSIPIETLALSENTKLPAIYICRKNRKTTWRYFGTIDPEIMERIKLILGEPMIH